MAMTYALLVGIDNYPPSVGSLRGCVADVAAIQTVLTRRISPEHLDVGRCLTSTPPARQSSTGFAPIWARRSPATSLSSGTRATVRSN